MAKKELLLILVWLLLEVPVFAEDKLYIFISFSLNKQMLNQLIEDASLNKATLVLRGLKDNNFKKTSQVIQELNVQNKDVSIIIDPNLFKKHKINVVPTYALGEHKLAGNVSCKFALEKFLKNAD